MGKDLEIADQVAEGEPHQDEAGERHEDFPANGRTEEVREETHLDRMEFDGWGNAAAQL
jgi:hypothetical protein